jgi:catechol 2,3-dioxygenase-like lactoylglutathione lyase family enzyme
MHIGHLALRATDVERSATFLTDILGLRRTHEENGAVSLSCNEKHHEIELLPGDRAGIDHLGLEVEDERDLDALRDALIASGARILSETPQEPGLRQAIRALAPTGLVLELYTGMAREPLSVEHYMPPLARRFGHVTFAVTDREEMERFLIDVLDFRITDTLSDRVSWLRCDTDHHGIALVQAGKAELHHYAFELENWGAIERYADHLAFLGQRLVWGPGRHGPGRNLYTYLPDPDNTIVEGYADLLVVPDDANYRPIDWSGRGEAALNLWGPMPPPGWRDYGVPILAPADALEYSG